MKSNFRRPHSAADLITITRSLFLSFNFPTERETVTVTASSMAEDFFCWLVQFFSPTTYVKFRLLLSATGSIVLSELLVDCASLEKYHNRSSTLIR